MMNFVAQKVYLSIFDIIFVSIYPESYDPIFPYMVSLSFSLSGVIIRTLCDRRRVELRPNVG